METEEKAQMDRLLVTTSKLETAWSRIRSLEQDLEMATEELAKMALIGREIQAPVTPVNVENKDTPTTVHSDKTLVTESVTNIVAAQAKELAELKKNWPHKKRDLKKAAEEEQRKTAENLRREEENLQKGHQAYDRLKEEKEKVLQEKDKLRRMAETKIERLKEELHQQKDWEDRTHRQLNQKLKQKTDDFDHLHRDYKHLDTE